MGASISNNCSVTLDEEDETQATVTNIADTNEGLCQIKDGMYDGNTYYYRGAVNNNWIKFAGIYWRIIRINGDGSIRMIYSETTAPTSETATVMTGTGTQTTTTAYNSTFKDNMYVGWKYTLNQVHGTGTSSSIRTYLVGDNGITGWYSSSGLSEYLNYIDDGIFCNDRSPSTSNTTSNGSGGAGTTPTYYGGYLRIVSNDLWKTNQIISTNCSDSNDIFTEKVGLITSDEILMAGGFGGINNTNYYLYTNQIYWSMTLSVTASNGNANLICISNNSLSWGCTAGASAYAVRPVINLKNTIQITGSGTYDDVYKVVGTND